MPREGDAVHGEFERYHIALEQHEEAPLCVIDDYERGLTIVSLDNFMLSHAFRKLEPRTGDVVMVRCLGEDPETGRLSFAVQVHAQQPERNLKEAATSDAATMRKAA